MNSCSQLQSFKLSSLYSEWAGSIEKALEFHMLPNISAIVVIGGNPPCSKGGLSLPTG